MVPMVKDMALYTEFLPYSTQTMPYIQANSAFQ